MVAMPISQFQFQPKIDTHKYLYRINEEKAGEKCGKTFCFDSLFYAQFQLKLVQNHVAMCQSPESIV